MPDFDIDFCQDRRDEVIRYVQERYGRDQVAQIITFGTLQARGVLRDVGRVLEMPYGQVDKLCKLVPQNPAAPVTLAKAIEGEPKLQAERDGNPVVKRAFDIALKLEGLYRHASTHAAGIVIGDRPLSRARADVPRSEIRHAGDPVQHEMGRAGGPGEVRLPRPEDADGAADRGAAPQAARHRARSCGDPARRQEDLRSAVARRGGRHLPTGKSGHAPRAARHEARPFRGHHRAGRALPSRPDGQHPDLLRPQARARRSRNTSIPSSSRSCARPTASSSTRSR